jgi:hypothetical protein
VLLRPLGEGDRGDDEWCHARVALMCAALRMQRCCQAQWPRLPRYLQNASFAAHMLDVFVGAMHMGADRGARLQALRGETIMMAPHRLSEGCAKPDALVFLFDQSARRSAVC